MTENFSRKAFYDQIRVSIYGGRISSEKTVLGIDAIFDACARYHLADLVHIAAVLANVRLEVNRNMFPVREGFKGTDRESIAHVAGLLRDGRIRKNYATPDPETGLSYFGRGQIQLTHANNYMIAGRKIGVDLYKFPEKALEVEYSARIAVLGSIEGWWRKDKDGRHTLARYIKGDKIDFRGLRNIVNGDRREDELQHYMHLFLSALIEAAKYPADAPEPSKKEKGDATMSGILGRLLGGTNGDNLLRTVFGLFTGGAVIESPIVGGNVTGGALADMGIMPMLLVGLLFLITEKQGADRRATPAPDQDNE